MSRRITEAQKRKAIEIYFEENVNEAEDVIRNPDKLDRLLRDLEEKLATIPALGGALASIPLLASLVKNYATRQYTDIPVGCLAAIVGALTYFLAPVDLIPDALPGIGYADDAAVLLACLKLVRTDLDRYRAWRDSYYSSDDSVAD